MFLPHGYEGQGPEHSSARLERYLQLCAEHNIQVCVPSTPAQQFHMIRRQMLRSFRKPLVVMTPKSLLRHRLSTSSLEDLVGGRFQPVIQEIDELSATKVKRVVVCSGKVYFDLLEKRREENIDDVAIVRLEQLYPFPEEEYAKVLGHWSKAKEIIWCQEEPQNQGAWYQIRHRLTSGLLKGQSLDYAGRKGAASTAAGYHSLHVQEQQQLVSDALGLGASAAAKTSKKTTKKKA
jgi:2-oxoglutarate dehydrogenase E1 component